MTVRNRIREHRRVRAGDLIPHELNWRRHPRHQRAALEALFKEVGYARSLLAYELPDGRLKLIDGHLRRDIDPDMLVDVEVLDVNDADARKLLLSIDSLASLAEAEADAIEQLASMTSAGEDILNDLWRSLTRQAATARAALPDTKTKLREQYMILVECADEAEQVLLLERWQADGIRCRALIS
jgi:hypothetical protein